MVRIDASNWMKCGLELVDGIGHASVVVTREFSRLVHGSRDHHEGTAVVAHGSKRLFA